MDWAFVVLFTPTLLVACTIITANDTLADASPAMIEWTIDEPDVSLLTALSDGTVVFVWEVDTDVAWFEWYLGSNTSIASAVWQIIAEPMLEVQHLQPSTSYALSVRAMSVAGVTGAPATYAWTVSACPVSLPVVDASISMMSSLPVLTWPSASVDVSIDGASYQSSCDARVALPARGDGATHTITVHAHIMPACVGITDAPMTVIDWIDWDTSGGPGIPPFGAAHCEFDWPAQQHSDCL